MTSTKMFIPDRIKVGFQNRDSTYTGKLAYVIYFDNKGVLRKEKSWESWRDKKIDPIELSNEPVSGFVLNKKVGGVHGSWSSYNVRQEYVRVYDPRDFEFEISIPNLLFILQECSSVKGKGLEGEFVYAWDGTSLVLLPVNCKEYQDCKIHTERQSKKINKEDMKEGYTYIFKDGRTVMYLGRHPYNEPTYRKDYNPVGNRHVFLLLKTNDPDEDCSDCYIQDTGFTKIAECITDTCAIDFAEKRDRYLKSRHYSIPTDIELVSKTLSLIELYYNSLRLIKEGNQFRFIEVKKDNSYGDYYNRFRYNNNSYLVNKSDLFTPVLNKGKVEFPKFTSYHTFNETDLLKLDFYELYIVTEYGAKLKVV